MSTSPIYLPQVTFDTSVTFLIMVRIGLMSTMVNDYSTQNVRIDSDQTCECPKNTTSLQCCCNGVLPFDI